MRVRVRVRVRVPAWANLRRLSLAEVRQRFEYG